MNNFYIVTNVTKDKSLETTDYIEKYLTEHGRHVTVMVRGGIEKGMQEGMQKGMQKGIEKGIEKGRQEEKLQIAQKMKEQGLDSELIAQCSGLSVEDIERL